jgi:8-amino-7-oxononanoate synthase
MTTWDALVADRNQAIATAGRWRQVRPLDGPGPDFTLEDGHGVVSFASNDYLGLSQHPLVKAAAIAATEQWGTGSGSSRLVVGDRPPHRHLEAALAAWKNCEAAVVLPTGFAANLAVLATFGADGVLVCSDELNHASIVDGCRLARGRTEIYRHRDIDHAAGLLARHDGAAIVVTDTVFSMDGDLAPVEELADLCRQTRALLILDEAHAVLGPHPADTLEDISVLRVGTLSKTLGSVGGFVAGPRTFIDLLINAARPFIFTTAPTPADSAAALAALQVLRSPDGADLLARLAGHVQRIAPGHPSPIVPVILGDERRALDAAAALLQAGLLVPAIRPPTVPAGTSRLRVTLSATHTDEHVDRLAKALAGL